MSSSCQPSQDKTSEFDFNKAIYIKAIHQFESMKFAEYCDDNIRSDLGRYDYMPGINHPYDAAISCQSSAILDAGSYHTYVNDRRLISNLQSDLNQKLREKRS
jgi:hypothetical protein